jgi:hypothetical protein
LPLEHEVPTVHAPVALQVSGSLELSQFVWPGAHTPEHVPITHV